MPKLLKLYRIRPASYWMNTKLNGIQMAGTKLILN